GGTLIEVGLFSAAQGGVQLAGAYADARAFGNEFSAQDAFTAFSMGFGMHAVAGMMHDPELGVSRGGNRESPYETGGGNSRSRSGGGGGNTRRGGRSYTLEEGRIRGLRDEPFSNRRGPGRYDTEGSGEQMRNSRRSPSNYPFP